MGRENGTQIGIGKTDGYRYVAVKPPLTDDEKDALVELGLVDHIGQFEEVSRKPLCTNIRLGAEDIGSYYLDEAGTILANGVANLLSELRSGNVDVNEEIVHLGYGSQTSAFNPIAE